MFIPIARCKVIPPGSRDAARPDVPVAMHVFPDSLRGGIGFSFHCPEVTRKETKNYRARKCNKS